MSAVDLQEHPYRDRYRRIVLLAAVLHDLGKANDHFQAMIRGSRDVRTNPQGLRHEWVTILMLQQLREWLLPSVRASEVDFAIAEWVVAGHHPAYHHDSPPRQNPDGSGIEIRLMTAHPDFQTALSWIADVFDLRTAPNLTDEVRPLRGAAPPQSDTRRAACRRGKKHTHRRRRGGLGTAAENAG
jgi:CRISPR-associated endonuclease/helicase Cas3